MRSAVVFHHFLLIWVSVAATFRTAPSRLVKALGCFSLGQAAAVSMALTRAALEQMAWAPCTQERSRKSQPHFTTSLSKNPLNHLFSSEWIHAHLVCAAGLLQHLQGEVFVSGVLRWIAQQGHCDTDQAFEVLDEQGLARVLGVNLGRGTQRV